jgi:hypothetical protein
MLVNSSIAWVSPEPLPSIGCRAPSAAAPAVLLDVHLVIIGIGEAVEIGADHRLRLVPFGDRGRLEPAFEARPGVQADEVHEVRPCSSSCAMIGVVVVRLADVAVGAGLGLVRRTVCGKCGAKAWLE